MSLRTINRYLKNSRRLLFKSTRKPRSKELIITMRITALGIVFIGFIGYVLHLLINVVVGGN